MLNGARPHEAGNGSFHAGIGGEREVVGARHLNVLPLSKGLRQPWALSQNQIVLTTDDQRRDRDGQGICWSQARIARLRQCPHG